MREHRTPPIWCISYSNLIKTGQRRHFYFSYVREMQAKDIHMVCHHLQQLEQELIYLRIKETYRGQAWGANCREWVYFDCYLNLAAIRQRIAFDDCVIDHVHKGTHDGQECGFFCKQCLDAIMGVHQDQAGGRKEIT
jgi:hypothetical protein